MPKFTCAHTENNKNYRVWLLCELKWFEARTIAVVQSVTKSCQTLCDPVDGSTPGFPVLHCLLEFGEMHVHWVGDAIQPSCPSSWPSPPAFHSSPASGSFLMSWLFTSGGQSSSICPSNEYSGLISFRIDWFDLLSIQGTFKSLLQHHSPKHQFFGTQPSLWPNSHIHMWLVEKYYID